MRSTSLMMRLHSPGPPPGWPCVQLEWSMPGTAVGELLLGPTLAANFIDTLRLREARLARPPASLASRGPPG